ncbi:LysE family translocator [Psychrosphaera sp. B3R10]|nr:MULTISPECIES: LysE family translocator [unclassified Psychrosphaera]MBU2882666.1 LysE family translocator [Psychrosphaera sp. I2R16]MBU2989315.1 LysE family translocator [Psychrosphaera sp. B3R10]MDO6718149.1 LysE family translocator [Psychrosphaera sp. 1_MG-2023]
METLMTLALFAFVSSITPGPNNLMLLSSGVNFGWRRTLPHMIGVASGFTLMVFLVGIGVIQLFDMVPQSYVVLKWFCIVYLSYLAVKIARSGNAVARESGSVKPMTFMQAVLFQWVNPKAWTMALSAISVYAPERDLISVIWVSLIFAAINLPSITVWVVVGDRLQQFLTSAVKLKVFNYSMATLLILSLFPVIME